jgi:DNA-binding NarL/FixJ family response regulator
MSPSCQRRHDVEVISIDRHRVPASLRDGTDGWKRIAVADRNAMIPDLAAFRIDFTRWIQLLTDRDRKIINVLSGGDTTKAVAQQFGLSEGRVSQLRRKFERLWLAFQGECAEAAA